MRGEGRYHDGENPKMSEQSEKAARKPRSIEDEITKAAAKLKRLQDELREKVRKDRERNQKEVLELLRSEGLDEISAEQWKVRLEAVKTALRETGAERTPAAQGGTPATVTDGASV